MIQNNTLRTTRLIPLAALLITPVGFITPDASGQCMACRVPALPVSMAEEEGKMGWNLSLIQGYRYSDETYSGTTDTGGGMETTVHQTVVGLEWQATSRFGFQLAVPYFWEFHREEIEEETVDLDGFGDLRLGLTFRPQPQGNEWLKGLQFIAGIETPTGADDNRVKNDDLGFALFEGLTTNSQFQLGSGTWDPFFGINYVKAVGGGLSVYSQSLAQWSFGESSKGLEIGDHYSTELGLKYAATEKLTLQAGIESSWRAHDSVDGETIRNSGGVVVSAAILANYDVTETVTLSAGVRIPIWRDLNASRFSASSSELFGTSISSQSSPGPYYYGGVTFHF